MDLSKNPIKSLQEFINKADDMKKQEKMDLSSDQDLTIAIMNLVSIEEHFFFTGAKTGKNEYYDLINEVREIRKELLKKLDETPKELLQIAIVELRQRFNSSANEIIVPFPLNLTIPDITITVPQKGDKKHLLELSGNNVKHYILEKKKKQEAKREL